MYEISEQQVIRIKSHIIHKECPVCGEKQFAFQRAVFNIVAKVGNTTTTKAVIMCPCLACGYQLLFEPLSGTGSKA